MTPQEANKLIAEYMGVEYVEYKTYKCPVCDFSEFKGYSESLDRLVPVWEKIKQIPLFNRTGEVDDPKWLCEIECENSNPKFNYVSGHAITIQEAACIATARAIKELK